MATTAQRLLSIRARKLPNFGKVRVSAVIWTPLADSSQASFFVGHQHALLAAASSASRLGDALAFALIRPAFALSLAWDNLSCFHLRAVVVGRAFTIAATTATAPSMFA